MASCDYNLSIFQGDCVSPKPLSCRWLLAWYQTTQHERAGGRHVRFITSPLTVCSVCHCFTNQEVTAHNQKGLPRYLCRYCVYRGHTSAWRKQKLTRWPRSKLKYILPLILLWNKFEYWGKAAWVKHPNFTLCHFLFTGVIVERN